MYISWVNVKGLQNANVYIIVYIIDPRYCPLDKEIRDEMQRAKLVGYTSSSSILMVY